MTGAADVRARSFWTFAATLLALFAGAGAPTPLYTVYEARYGFSPVVLTLIFAIYVLALLATFVIAGRVSDHAGRRPPILVALPILIVAMVAFLLADGTAWLFVARAIQGVATGLATAALSAGLLDTSPPEAPGRGALISSAAPLAGLAIGALGAGILVQVGPDPTRLVFWILTAFYVAAFVAVATIPECTSRRGNWRAALRPEVRVPPALRSTFAVISPCMMATWALGGLYLSLGPSLTRLLTGSSSYVVGGLVVVCLMGTGALTSALTPHVPPERRMVGGTALVIAGVVVTIAAIAARSTALLFAGSVIAGLGFGPSFAGAFAILTSRADPHERAGLVSAIYVVSYTAFSVPAVVAGIAANHSGLRPTAIVYASVVVVLAGLAITAYARLARRVATAV